MRMLDRIASVVVLGAIAPVVLMLAGWWGSFIALGDSPWIGRLAFAGLAAGLVLDATVLRRRLTSLFTLSVPALLGVALFYSVMVYGFFMGFVVANALVGIAAGWAAGRGASLRGDPSERSRRDARTVAASLTAVLFALCIVTAWLALGQPSLPSELSHMFGLPFVPTREMIVGLIVVGGAGLVVAEYGATLVTARWAARH